MKAVKKKKLMIVGALVVVAIIIIIVVVVMLNKKDTCPTGQVRDPTSKLCYKKYNTSTLTSYGTTIAEPVPAHDVISSYIRTDDDVQYSAHREKSILDCEADPTCQGVYMNDSNGPIVAFRDMDITSLVKSNGGTSTYIWYKST